MIKGSRLLDKLRYTPANVAPNPIFSGTYVGGFAPNWSAYSGGVGAENVDTDYILFGTQSQHVTADAADKGINTGTFTILNGLNYTVFAKIYVVSGRVRLDAKFGTNYAPGIISGAGVTGWVDLKGSKLSNGTSGQIFIYSSGGAAEWYVTGVWYQVI